MYVHARRPRPRRPKNVHTPALTPPGPLTKTAGVHNAPGHHDEPPLPFLHVSRRKYERAADFMVQWGRECNISRIRPRTPLARLILTPRTLNHAAGLLLAGSKYLVRARTKFAHGLRPAPPIAPEKRTTNKHPNTQLHLVPNQIGRFPGKRSALDAAGRQRAPIERVFMEQVLTRALLGGARVRGLLLRVPRRLRPH